MILKNALVMSMEQPNFVGDVQIEGTKIAAVGNGLSTVGQNVIDCTGKVVLPGLVDPHCHVGMWEDGIGDEGADGNACSDPITPHLRAIDGMNPFDPCFQEACEAGITTVVSGPGSANVIGGQFAAVKTYGRSLEEMLLRQPVAMKAALGENPKREYGDQKATPYTRMAIASLFRKTMVLALQYQEKIDLAAGDPEKMPDKDVALEALLPVLSGELPLKVHAHRADDILTALRLAREFGLHITIEHCTEGHLITEVLREETEALGAGVILGPLLSDRAKVELKNLDFRAPRILYEAGIPFAMMSDHPVTPSKYLPVYAALAVREGLPEEEALRAITINAANIVGIGDRVGSIKVGKDADFAIFNDNPLNFTTKCGMTIINGSIVYRAE
ncbi:MAG: amidohydrolase [Eubacteriales bacterium]|nr:amidohydrolase [Eubacteriales bacterium]